MCTERVQACMTSRCVFAPAAALIVGLASGPQSAAQVPTFDTASVKPNRSSDTRLSISTRGGIYTAVNAPLRTLILIAYELGFEPFRLVGGPDWISSERFDVLGTLPAGSTSRQIGPMLRALLADRFKLAVHTETRDLPAYALVLARNDGRLGPQLRRSTADCVATPPACRTSVGSDIRATGQALTALAGTLPQFVSRRVFDRTGLSGLFDFELRFSDTDPAVAGGDLPSIFTALQEQLGLKLEPTRGPAEVIVIDRIARPTED